MPKREKKCKKKRDIYLLCALDLNRSLDPENNISSSNYKNGYRNMRYITKDFIYIFHFTNNFLNIFYFLIIRHEIDFSEINRRA